jgi:hypothetical protein
VWTTSFTAAEFHFTSQFFGDVHGDIFMRVFAKSISQVRGMTRCCGAP